MIIYVIRDYNKVNFLMIIYCMTLLDLKSHLPVSTPVDV